jgi:mercuric ion transport protein
MNPTVELVYDSDCPNVGEARAQLMRAFAQTGFPARWREWRRDHDRAPARVRGLGSPSILVNGRDVAPAANVAPCCRVYQIADGTLAAVPPIETIASAIREGGFARTSWKSAGLWGPALGIAFLPKLICPACWPAYAALVSAAGVPFLLETRFLLPLTIAALLLVLGLLAWRAPTRHGFGPLTVGVLASAAVVVGKFTFDSTPAAYLGATVLFAACVWNSWPRRRAARGDCPACVPSGASRPEGGNHG